jgi:hypothetical protein
MSWQSGTETSNDASRECASPSSKIGHHCQWMQKVGATGRSGRVWGRLSGCVHMEGPRPSDANYGNNAGIHMRQFITLSSSSAVPGLHNSSCGIIFHLYHCMGSDPISHWKKRRNMLNLEGPRPSNANYGNNAGIHMRQFITLSSSSAVPGLHNSSLGIIFHLHHCMGSDPISHWKKRRNMLNHGWCCRPIIELCQNVSLSSVF